MEDILYIVQVTIYHNSNQYLIDNKINSYGWTSFIQSFIHFIFNTSHSLFWYQKVCIILSW